MAKYLCFTKDHDPEKAKTAFRERYHLEPKEAKYEHNILWIGPIPGSDLPDTILLRPVNLESVQYPDETQIVMF